MDPSIVFEKTPKGEDALRHRDGTLPSDLRMVLLIINGSRNVETIQMVSDPCRESIAPLIFLEDNGYIQRIGSRDNIFSFRGNNPVAAEPSMEPQTQRAQPAYQAQPQMAAPQPLYQPPPQLAPQPQYQAAPQPQVAVQPMQIDNSLALKLAALRTYLAQTLGQDADAVMNRVAEVRSQQEYQAMVGKLYAIIRDYAGVRDAERFMQRFENT
jgi:predicted component of type VI protein secretion system